MFKEKVFEREHCLCGNELKSEFEIVAEVCGDCR